MTKSPKKAARRQRHHGDLPAGFKWRDGRPRWEPSPTRRQQGWRGVDLKDAWNRWLALGAAVARAQAIAEAVAGWADGRPVPAAFAGFAPKCAPRGAAASDLNPRSIGALLDEYKASPRFLALAPKTRGDYASKLRRFLETLAKPEDPKKLAAFDADKALAALRALSIDILLPPAFNEPGDFEIERAYERLLDETGQSMATGVMACVSAWLSWCVKKKRVWPSNPALLVERKPPDGRIVVFDWPELVALVRQAEASGIASIADALILAVDLSWSQQDILAMTWGQIAGDHCVKHRRIKTGVAGNPPLLSIGKARVKAIRARWAEQNVTPAAAALVIVCELTGQAWAADTFRHKFAEIRSLVAKQHPDVAAKQFRDLRDTAVTYCIDAGLDINAICSRTLHSPTHAQAVIHKHYGAIRQGVADQAAETLDAHFEKLGYTFDAPLALPAPKEG